MATPTLTVHLQLGTPEHGLWCDSCLLPSVARWPVFVLLPGPVVQPLGDVTACPTCVDLAVVVRDAVGRVARQLGGTVVDGPG